MLCYSYMLFLLLFITDSEPKQSFEASINKAIFHKFITEQI
jgi:hypothetical protein